MARSTRADVGRGEGAVIGRTTRVRGKISGDGGLVLEGSVEGDVAVTAAVTIRGELEGDVQTRGPVRIESGAKVKGDMQGESFMLEEGADFAGRLDADFELPPELGGSGGGRRRH
jgi:cytoskeletal protein CcmA (bactofilin family)